jgi:NADH-quinone oxidoreductase subunit C
MKKENLEALKKQFPGAVLDENVSEFSTDETSLTIEKSFLLDILRYLKQVPGPGFDKLVDLTAVDYLVPNKHTKVIYLLRNPGTKEFVRVAVILGRQEPLFSISELWRGADWYERELFDLFGVIFSDRPDIERILMPDDWQGHPLRRDYALTEESVEFKHGVMPKVPSEIIPYVKRNAKS